MMAKKARLSLLVAFVISLPSASAFLGGNVINWLGMNTAIKLQPNLLNSMNGTKLLQSIQVAPTQGEMLITKSIAGIAGPFHM